MENSPMKTIKCNNSKNSTATAVSLLLWSSLSLADISFDHSSVVPANMQGQHLSGDMTIRADYGKQLGSNLFHSFDSFNINQGETATFTNDGASAAIHNVIGRVTGGNSSTINGLLRSTIPNANVYLLNPNGIVFAPLAQLDIKGAFHASTAAGLNFKDGGHFDALSINNDVLTAAPVKDFGFIAGSANNNGTITINGSQLNQTETDLKTLDVTAGNISIENNAVITLPTGEIRLVAMQGEGQVSLIANNHAILPLPSIAPNANNAGSISIKGGEDTQRSKLITSGSGAGNISLWGGDIGFNNARAFNDNKDDINTTPINANVDKAIAIHANNLLVDNSFITTDANAANAAAITVNATANTIIAHAAAIKSDVNAAGNAGRISVNSATLTIDGKDDKNGYTGIYSTTNSATTGNAGDVEVKAKEIDILNNGHLYSITQGLGNTGTVKVSADNLNINNKGYISSSTYSSGNAENVTVQAKTINIDGGFISSNTFGQGNAENVTVQTDILNITNGGKVASITQAQGNAGNVNLKISHYLNINGHSDADTGIFSQSTKPNSGNSGSINISNTKNLNIAITSGGKISSITTSIKGNAGAITIAVDSLTIDGEKSSENTTGISSEAARDKGLSGDIVVNTKKLTMDNKAIILANTNSKDKAGNIALNIKDNAVLNNSFIGSSTFGYGEDGGTVSINTPKLTLDNASKISATANRSAAGGNIAINATSFNLLNKSEISARNTGTGNAGAIEISAKNSVIKGNSFVTVASNQGDAGDIHINTPNSIYMLNSQLITSAADGKGNGGNISISADYNNNANNTLIKPTFVVLNNSSIVANALRGNGGKIDILTRFFLQSTDSIVQASSQFGLQGTVSINSANANIAGSISVLTGTFMDASRLVQEDCNKHYEKNSSFVVRSGGTVLPSPDNQLNYIPSSLDGCLMSF
jgi:filamentous hemagglutinin family protein